MDAQLRQRLAGREPEVARDEVRLGEFRGVGCKGEARREEERRDEPGGGEERFH